MSFEHRFGTGIGGSYEDPIDLFEENVLFQGDCLKSFELIENNSIDLIIADPPYNIGIAEWDNIDNYVRWCKKWLNECVRVMKNNSTLYIFCGYPFAFEYYNLLKNKLNYQNELIWWFSTGMPQKYRYRIEHENILMFMKGKREINHDDIRIPYETKDKRHNPKGKSRGTVLRYSRIKPNYKVYLGHPTQKPIELIEVLIKASSNPVDVIFDPFLGSGTTMEACQNLDRVCLGSEINSEYCNTIMNRCNPKKIIL